MASKGWPLDDEYIVYMIIFYLGWTMVQEFTYELIEYKKKCLVRCIDWLTIKKCMRS